MRQPSFSSHTRDRALKQNKYSLYKEVRTSGRRSGRKHTASRKRICNNFGCHGNVAFAQGLCQAIGRKPRGITAMSESSAWQQGHTRALMGMPKGRTSAQAATSSERTRSQSTSSTRRPSGPPPARYSPPPATRVQTSQQLLQLQLTSSLLEGTVEVCGQLTAHFLEG